MDTINFWMKHYYGGISSKTIAQQELKWTEPEPSTDSCCMWCGVEILDPGQLEIHEDGCF